MSSANHRPSDPDDLFAHTRMSIGDHIEELRTHLFRAIIGLAICLILGFILDGLGEATGLPIGLGKPVMKRITEPVETQLNVFNDALDAKHLEEVKKELAQDAARAKEVNQPRPVEFTQSGEEVKEYFAAVGLPVNPAGPVTWKGQVRPLEWEQMTHEAAKLLRRRASLKSFSVMEAFLVYFKVSLLCGVVLSSPWIFWQLWSFVAAGLYPHEKGYVYKYLPFSLGLFLGGVALCQFLVLPNAVRALLAFNSWLGIEPDLRLNEWLGFAILMPLIFGVSFQTPLVMFFLERIGIFGADDYRSKRRIACFVLAAVAAIIMPAPDPMSMIYLWVPLYLLYEVGILLCHLAPRPIWEDAPETEEMVGV